MSKRSSPSWWRYSREATNLNRASGSMNRLMSQALAIRIDVDPGSRHPGTAPRLLLGHCRTLRLGLMWREPVSELAEQSFERFASAAEEEIHAGYLGDPLLQARELGFQLGAAVVGRTQA